MWLCNPDEAIELYSNGLWQPVLRSWYESEELLAKWTQTDARPSGYMDAVVDMTVNHILPLEASYINNFDQMDAIIESSLEPLWLALQALSKPWRTSTSLPIWMAQELQSDRRVNNHV